MLRHAFPCVLSLACLLACSEAGEPGSSTDMHPDPHDHPEAHRPEVVELTSEAAERAGIRLGSVVTTHLAGRLETTGEVDFDHTLIAHVSPRLGGRVHQVYADLGDDVAPGEVLAVVDSIDLGRAKAAYLQAKTHETLARELAERKRALFDSGITPEQEWLADRAAHREAVAALRSSEEVLHLYGLSQAQIDTLTYEDREASIYPLRAPFAATVVERHATLGELVTPERNLFTLADLSRVWIWIDVYQRDLGGVHLDDQARARVDAFPDEVFAGTVSYLSAQVDTDTRTVRARLDVANPEGKLRPGMFVEVELIDPHARESDAARSPSLAVPEGAVARDGDELMVFVAAGERRYERRDVETGRRLGGFVEILNGLEMGESVVVEGVFLLKSAASKESLGGGHDH